MTLDANTQEVTKESPFAQNLKNAVINNPFFPGLVMQGLMNPALRRVEAKEKERKDET